MKLSDEQIAHLRKSGFVRRRLLGGYTLTRRGRSLMADAVDLDEELRAEMSEYTGRWQTMTKDETDEVLIGLLPGVLERNEARIAGYFAEMQARRWDPEAEK